MAAQPGISTTSAPPNTVVAVQPGMNVQPVVLVDQNGQYVTASTANALATTTVPVNVGNATAPTSGQVLTATSGTAATWQPVSAELPLTTLGDIMYENATPAPARLAGNTTATKNYLVQTGTGAVSAAPAWGTIAAGDVPTLNQNTSGNAGGLSSTLAPGSGGTGQVTLAAAYNALSPMTTTGDIEYESAANTASRLAGPTSATKQFLTSTGTGSAAQAPAWGTIVAGDLPTGTTSTKGALQLDGTATDIVALGTQAAGAVGKPADAGHVHPSLDLILAPSGATAETHPRRYASTNTAAQNSGTLYVNAIAMAAGIAVNNITMATGATAKTGGTHGWYVLLDSNLVVRAVTTDQTDASTVWGTINTAYTLSVAASAYTTTYTGLYYVGVMVAETSGTMPVFICTAAPANVVAAIAPILSGSSNTGQTTPPTTGTTMTSITESSRPYYAYTS